MQVDAEKIRAFIRKWDLNRENDSCENFTEEQQMELERDNPLCLHFDSKVELNGRKLRPSHGCAVSWNPCLPEGRGNQKEAKRVVDHRVCESLDLLTN